MWRSPGALLVLGLVAVPVAGAALAATAARLDGLALDGEFSGGFIEQVTGALASSNSHMVAIPILPVNTSWAAVNWLH